MIIPIIYPSAGEFWLRSNAYALLGYSFNNRKLTNLPSDHNFNANSRSSVEAAGILDLSLPLYLAAPHENYKRKGPTCVIRSYPKPFPPKSFAYLKRGNHDIYIACPELCFLLAARSLDFIDLVKFGYDLCAIYTDASASKFGRIERTSFTFVSFIRDYIKANRYLYGSVKSLKALKYVHDFSNSPAETKLAMFATLPPEYGGCGLSGLEMNKAINLTSEGKRIVGYSQLRGDLVFQNCLVVEYNSNAFHLDPKKYTDDMNRQTALKLAGYDYIAITAGNIRYMNALTEMMNAIRIRLGMDPLDENNRARTELYFRLFQ